MNNLRPEKLRLQQQELAQETTPGQDFSLAILILSTTLKPLMELPFGAASFSLFILAVALLSNNIEASQP